MTLHALLAQSVCVIDLQNCVLLDDAEQQQQAKTGKDIHRLKRHQQRHNAERNRQRQREQNRDRMDEGFKLRGQDHVHKDE